MTSDLKENMLPMQQEIDLVQILRTVWRGKFLILACMFFAALAGIWYAYFQATPVFTASAVVVLESRQDQVVDLESVVSGLSADQATINTEVEVIKSRGLIEKLVLELGLLEDPEFNSKLRDEGKFSVGNVVTAVRIALGLKEDTPPQSERTILDATIDQVTSILSVSNVRQTFVFRLTATTEDGEKSAEIANTLSRLYILEQLEVKFEATEQATEWLTGRVGQLQIELETAEATVKEFNAGTTLVSPEALIGLNRQLKELRDRVREVTVADEASAKRVDELKSLRETGDLETIVKVAQDTTLSRVYRLIKSSGSDDPDLGAFNARFEQVIQRAELQRSRAEGQVKALLASIEDLEEQITNQSKDLVELQQLQREADASRLIYEFFLQRLKETSIQQGIQQADSRLLSKAVVPLHPSAPRKSIILVVTLVLGFLAGFAVVLVREFSQRTFRESDQLEAMTGKAVVGQIPLIPIRKREKLLKYLFEKPTSATVEAIRNLRTSVLLSDLDNPPQVILMTSSVPGEGKTTISLSLASNLSGLGKKVLLMEGDIRRRTFAEYVDTKDKMGMLSTLSGKVTIEDAVFRAPLLDVDLLVGEKSTINAADFFSSNKFKEFLNDLRSKYDYIIIDAPPVLAVPDARIIAQSADALIYVVRWDSTAHRQVRDGLKAFESVKVPVSGLVLNQINSKKMKSYGYGENFGAYGAYYDS
jgi:capsular exopolysaccharide synthesis family protein